jgi:pimeloyl-ACP methyl ester carboxylesterase
MKNLCSKIATLTTTLVLVFLVSGCVHTTYDSIAIHNTPVSYRTNVGRGTNVLDNGQATIVFESGLGDGLESWNTVYNMLSESHQVFAYSRPGYQGSDNSKENDNMRTSDEIAQRLKILLNQTEIPGPYILVAHSFGSFSSLKFAELYPGDVQAVVLIDGRPKQYTRRCEGAGLSPCSPPELLAGILPSHLEYEIRGLAKSESLTPDPNQLPDIPITVIAATKYPPGAPRGAQTIWLEAQRDFAESVKRGRYVVASGSGHYIQKDRPILVTEEIKRLF